MKNKSTVRAAGTGTAVAVGAGAAVAVGAGAAIGVGTSIARRRRRRQPELVDGWYVVRRGVTVDRSRQKVLGFLADQERLAQSLGDWVTLEQLDDNRWSCVARDPVGTGGERRAELTVEDGTLRWRVEDGSVPQEGRVELTPAPGGRGTEIRAELRYRATGPLRRTLGLIRGDEPDLRLRDTLRRVKSLIECGQLIDTHRDPSGRGPAQERVTDTVRDKLTTGGRA
ncbi:cyclase [Plantactinospora siamensis]|uniref:Cyclase n=1 Tax=Plantactinospora siamensis TaxID=555372 RepID=A0ABV6P0C6_9ACTN